MNSSPYSQTRNAAGITRREVVVVIMGLMGVGSLLYAKSCWHASTLGYRAAKQAQNGHMLYYSLRNYASENAHNDTFPTFADPDTRTRTFTDSNDALGSLLHRYVDDKRIFFHKHSAWCTTTVKNDDAANSLLPGENDWVYVRGLKSSSPQKWPLLANAFAPGTTSYITDPTKPGGCWDGIRAAVIWADGHADVVKTKPSGDTYYVPRSDKPEANAFEKSEDWLTGENVEVLLPKLPN
jgi:hypothetical protein